ncbi:YDG domain-containing protein, partial [Paracoccaceae bacterium]|nr:YDG domain-containing protein [Paracoccaceae bacterium]
ISGSGYGNGGLLGYGERVAIENAYVTGKVTGTATATGGLVGETENALINNSYVLGDVSGRHHVGGLAGSFSSSSITNAYATGAVSGNDYIGGLVGQANNQTLIRGTFATGAVSGTNYVGGLVGFSAGSSADPSSKYAKIQTSYATGVVSGSESHVGGLVGRASYTHITNTYTTGKVTGQTKVGGLVGSSTAKVGQGFDRAKIQTSYATGMVSGSDDVGGLVGHADKTAITLSFWDKETTGLSRGIGASVEAIDDTSGATSAELRTQQTYTDAGWDFDNSWFMLDGQTRPFLRFEHSQTITNPRQLQLMAMKPDLDYTLGADIDMQAALQASHKDGNTDRYSGMWGAAGFAPIGDYPNIFTGTLDGLGHEIIGLKINRPDAARAGLFGLTVNANLQNITLRDAKITGKTAGGLVGNAYNTSFNNITSHNINVTGTDHVRGLVGQATINTNFNTIRLDDINVTGTGNVGGLVGNAYQNTTIETSYAKGTVTSTGTRSAGTNAGGLVGWAVDADIKTSYAAADVSGTSETANNTVGGLVGYAINTNIKNAYATGGIKASNKTVYIGGLVGKAYVNTKNLNYKIENTYAMGEVTAPHDNSGQTHIGGLVGCNWARGDSECAGDTKEQTYKIINSFWDMTTTGHNESSRGASGKTNEEMDRLATFTNATWNISEKGGEDMVWRIYEGQAAPLLRAFMEKVQVTGTGPEAQDYNGKTDATISDLQFAEAVDGVTFTSSGNGQYANANAGEDKTVTITYALADGEKDLHTVLQRYDFVEPELKGTINKKALTITANDASKTYGDTQTFDGTE